MALYKMVNGSKEYTKEADRMNLKEMQEFADAWRKTLPRGGVYEMHRLDGAGVVTASVMAWPKTSEFRKTTHAQGKVTYYIDGKRVSERIYKSADKVLTDKSSFKTSAKSDGKIIQEHVGSRP